MSRMRSFGIGTVSYYISVFIVQRISSNLCPGVTQKIEIASTESTARSFNLGYYHKISHPQTQKVRTTLYSVINSTTGKYCSVAFI